MSAKVMLVGEAYGEYEARLQRGFVGPTGAELLAMADEAKLITLTSFDREMIKNWWRERSPSYLAMVWDAHPEVYTTNVFNLRPENNDLETLCVPKGQGGTEEAPALKSGKYPRAEFRSELVRLYRELSETNPNVVLCLGGTAAWALLNCTGISKIRGTVAPSSFAVKSAVTSVSIKGFKVLPTYHPAAVLRDWSLRAVTVLDLAKAARESAFPEIRLPERTAYIEPDLADMEWFLKEHLVAAERISIDIETRGNQITCIGFAPSKSVSMTVPFVDERKSGNCYWPTAEAERAAWEWVRKVCALPALKDFQNGLYDLNFMIHYGIKVNNPGDDSMLAHHALQPESEKGLAFLGSVYSNESSWKLRYRNSTIKRDA